MGRDPRNTAEIWARSWGACGDRVPHPGRRRQAAPLCLLRHRLGQTSPSPQGKPACSRHPRLASAPSGGSGRQARVAARLARESLQPGPRPPAAPFRPGTSRSNRLHSTAPCLPGARSLPRSPCAGHAGRLPCSRTPAPRGDLTRALARAGTFSWTRTSGTPFPSWPAPSAASYQRGAQGHRPRLPTAGKEPKARASPPGARGDPLEEGSPAPRPCVGGGRGWRSGLPAGPNPTTPGSGGSVEPAWARAPPLQCAPALAALRKRRTRTARSTLNQTGRPAAGDRPISAAVGRARQPIGARSAHMGL